MRVYPAFASGAFPAIMRQLAPDGRCTEQVLSGRPRHLRRIAHRDRCGVAFVGDYACHTTTTTANAANNQPIASILMLRSGSLVPCQFVIGTFSTALGKCAGEAAVPRTKEPIKLLLGNNAHVEMFVKKGWL